MQNVMVNGSIEIVGSDMDIVDIVRECCGDDLARLIENRLCIDITDINSIYSCLGENAYNQLEKAILSGTDYYSYEASLDTWNCVGNDIIEECEKQIEYIEDAKRIDKNKLYNAFINISKIVSNIL